MGTKGKTSMKKKLNKANQKIKGKFHKSKNEDEDHILKTVDIELTDVENGDDRIHFSEEDIAKDIDNNNGCYTCVCKNSKSVAVVNEGTVCEKCGLHKIDEIHHDFSSQHQQQTDNKRKNKPKKKKKVSYRMWRACVMGWKYMKAGLILYVTPATAGLNVANLATAAAGRNEPAHTKYAYVYK